MPPSRCSARARSHLRWPATACFLFLKGPSGNLLAPIGVGGSTMVQKVLRNEFVKWMCLVFALAVISFTANAQENGIANGPYLKTSGSFAGSMGYRPGLAFGIGYDSRFSKVLLLSDAAFDTADKLDAKGSTIRAGAGLYFLKKKTGIGGGARCGRLATTAYDKTACRPFFGGIYDSKAWRFDAAYYLPGTDRTNHLQGVRTMSVLPLSKHFLMEMEMSVYTFHASNGTKRSIGVVFNPGLRYRF